MKAISIQQPWAELIVRGIKDIENRTWTTTYRGPLAIHAGLKPRPSANLERWTEVMEGRPAVRAILESDGKQFPRGGLVGVVDLVEIWSDHDSPWAVEDQFHWEFKSPRRCKFVPMKGNLGLWAVNREDVRPLTPKINPMKGR